MQDLPLQEGEYRHWLGAEMSSGTLIQTLRESGVPDHTLAWVMEADRDSRRRGVLRAARLVGLEELLTAQAAEQLDVARESETLKQWWKLVHAGSEPGTAVKVTKWARPFMTPLDPALEAFLTQAAVSRMEDRTVLTALGAMVEHDLPRDALEIAFTLVAEGTLVQTAFGAARSLAA